MLINESGPAYVYSKTTVMTVFGMQGHKKPEKEREELHPCGCQNENTGNNRYSGGSCGESFMKNWGRCSKPHKIV